MTGRRWEIRSREWLSGIPDTRRSKRAKRQDSGYRLLRRTILTGRRHGSSSRYNVQGATMIRFRTFFTFVLCFAFFSSLCIAQDLSKYRDFQFGMNVDSVAKQIQMKA